MKKVSIVAMHHAIIAAIGNASHMFAVVNGFLAESGKPALFDVRIVGTSREMKLNNGLYTVHTDAVLDELTQTDLIIIPPFAGELEAGINSNSPYIPWICEQYRHGAEVASLCVGAFLLAETGLLDGQECSTHWKSANEFRRRYPRVHLVDEKIITDYNGIYTSGGSNSYWNLLVYLVEKYADLDLAIRTSKYFEVEWDRRRQSPFMIFEGCKLHDDTLVRQAQQHIERNYQEKLSIGELLQLTHMSQRTFQRRFKKATHLNVSDYIQKVKVEAAKKLLETHPLTINEVMYEVGYQDPKAFREVFRKVTGLTPLTYKNKFSRTGPC